MPNGRRALDRPPATGSQRCGHCRRVKPVAEYRVDRARPTGYACYCRDCAQAYQRRWRAIQGSQGALIPPEAQPA